MITAIVLWAIVNGAPIAVAHWKVDATTPSRGEETLLNATQNCDLMALELRGLGVKVWCVPHVTL